MAWVGWTLGCRFDLPRQLSRSVANGFLGRLRPSLTLAMTLRHHESRMVLEVQERLLWPLGGWSGRDDPGDNGRAYLSRNQKPVIVPMIPVAHFWASGGTDGLSTA